MVGSIQSPSYHHYQNQTNKNQQQSQDPYASSSPSDGEDNRLIPASKDSSKASLLNNNKNKDTECQTCKERKYQDGSDDPGVSFKAPTSISPEKAASAVVGHEMEHVGREQDKAEQEGREVVYQKVSIHNSICPECGKVYVSGGTTETVTKKDKNKNEPFEIGLKEPELDLGNFVDIVA